MSEVSDAEKTGVVKINEATSEATAAVTVAAAAVVAAVVTFGLGDRLDICGLLISALVLWFYPIVLAIQSGSEEIFKDGLALVLHDTANDLRERVHSACAKKIEDRSQSA
jgi:hypothetical protein